MNPIDLITVILAEGNRAGLVQKMVERGADIDAHYTSGRTALMLAVLGASKFDDNLRQRFIETIEALIVNGADMNIRDEHAQTALDLALVLRQKDIAQLLLLKGAEVDSMIN